MPPFSETESNKLQPTNFARQFFPKNILPDVVVVSFYSYLNHRHHGGSWSIKISQKTNILSRENLQLYIQVV